MERLICIIFTFFFCLLALTFIPKYKKFNLFHIELYLVVGYIMSHLAFLILYS